MVCGDEALGKYPYQDVYKNCLSQEGGIECSVLALVCLMRCAYYTQHPDSQEIIDKFMAIR